MLGFRDVTAVTGRHFLNGENDIFALARWQQLTVHRPHASHVSCSCANRARFIVTATSNEILRFIGNWRVRPGLRLAFIRFLDPFMYRPTSPSRYRIVE